jgi:SAM-dependent methyltransferase
MGWSILLGVALLVVGVFLVTALFGAPYVPSRRDEITEAFARLRPLTGEDVVVDFGCGDGVVLRTVAGLGVKRVVGVELNPMLALLARLRSWKDKRVRVKCGNMLMVKLPKDMTVAYIFGLDRVMRMLKPRLVAYAKEQGRDIWVISLAFEFVGMKPEKKWGAYGLYRIVNKV